jgi:hypothetical protein
MKPGRTYKPSKCFVVNNKEVFESPYLGRLDTRAGELEQNSKQRLFKILLESLKSVEIEPDYEVVNDKAPLITEARMCVRWP